tara:strand:- start:2446 stop:2706 length:261 start_codon:yes stop_codon:yes gene_type:complete
MEEQPEAPNPLRNRPELYDDLAPVWEAFWFLNSSRPIGMEAGAIPLSEIIAYWRELHGLTARSDLVERVHLIRAMDTKFLELNREK